jgi:hypothetical protein
MRSIFSLIVIFTFIDMYFLTYIPTQISDHESDLKVTICLICLHFAIFYLLNKARIEIRLIRSKKVEFSS